MNVLPGLPKKQRVSLHSWCVKIIFAEKMNPLPRGNLNIHPLFISVWDDRGHAFCNIYPHRPCTLHLALLHGLLGLSSRGLPLRT